MGAVPFGSERGQHLLPARLLPGVVADRPEDPFQAVVLQLDPSGLAGQVVPVPSLVLEPQAGPGAPGGARVQELSQGTPVIGCTCRTTHGKGTEASGNSAPTSGAPPSHSTCSTWGRYTHSPRPADFADMRNGISRLPRPLCMLSECTHTNRSPPATVVERASTRVTMDTLPGLGSSRTRIASCCLSAWATIRLTTEL